MKFNHTFSVLFWIAKSKQNNQGLAPIYVRITIDGERAEYSIKRYIDSEHWDNKGERVMASHPEANSLNEYLALVRSEINRHYNILLSTKDYVTAELVKEHYLGLHLKKLVKKSFLHHFDEYIKILEKKLVIGDLSLGRLKKFKVLRGKLQAFVKFKYKNNNLMPADMKLNFIVGFEHYLRTEHKIGHNTAMKYSNQFYHRDGIKMLHCMAHARRYFKEAEDNDKQRSTYALKLFQEIYDVEREIKELSDAERRKIRQEVTLPKLNELHAWMTEQYRTATPKSPIGKALEYSLKRWQELILFTTDGLLEIDNNKIENEIRPIALGRKNYLFAGSHESAQRIAMIYSLLPSCKANGIDPCKWLTHVLEELPNRTVNNIEDLLPTKSF